MTLGQKARGMGIYFFITISGRKPFIRQVFTNGTLINERMSGIPSELGNVLPAMSIEGWEKETAISVRSSYG